MNSQDRDAIYLELAIEMIEKVGRKCSVLSEIAFVEAPDEVELMAFRLAQIGECCGKLTSDLKLRHADIPWPKIVGMRNLIVHEYMRVIPARLWRTAADDLAPLLIVCREELSSLDT